MVGECHGGTRQYCGHCDEHISEHTCGEYEVIAEAVDRASRSQDSLMADQRVAILFNPWDKGVCVPMCIGTAPCTYIIV